MYKYLLLLITLIGLQSCGQSNKTMDNEVNEIFGNLYKDVKYYDQRINYHADIFIGGCNYEILINDMLVDSYFGEGNGAMTTSIPINTAILNKGEQTWKIRVYPVHDRKEINGKISMIPRPEIQKGARVEINIEGIRFKEDGGIEKSFGKVVDFEAPLTTDPNNGNNIFADAGKPYIEYTGVFIADVPYTLAGWKNSIDLSKEDQKKLKTELLQEYGKYKNWIQNKELDKIAKANLNSEKETAQALFYNKNTNDMFITNFINGWGQKELKMYPLENYKLSVYANGKIITLERTDILGYPSLIGSYDLNGEDRAKWFNLYFHRPKPGAPLEVIR